MQLQPDSSNLFDWLMENFNLRYIGLGIMGGTVGMLRRKRKNSLESFLMVLVGTVCAAVFTDPIHALLALKYPEYANLKGIRDAMAVVVASIGWSLIRWIVWDLPRLLKRYISANAEFIKNEVNAKNDDV